MCLLTGRHKKDAFISAYDDRLCRGRRQFLQNVDLYMLNYIRGFINIGLTMDIIFIELIIVAFSVF